MVALVNVLLVCLATLSQFPCSSYGDEATTAATVDANLEAG